MSLLFSHLNPIHILRGFIAVLGSVLRILVRGGSKSVLVISLLLPLGYGAAVDAQTTNLALGRPATQSSTYPATAGFPYSSPNGFAAGFAVDSDPTTIAHTAWLSEPQPWWQVDLGSVATSIDTVEVWHRADCCPEQLSNFYVFVSDNVFTSSNLNSTIGQPGVSSYAFAATAGRPTGIPIGRTGRYVRIQLANQATEALSIAEVRVIGAAGGSQPGITLSYLGKVQDKVGPGEQRLSPDGISDGTFQVMLTGGARTVTRLDLRRSDGTGIWDTIGTNGYWTLGASRTLGGTLVNTADDAVSFAVADGGSLYLYAADFVNAQFPNGLLLPGMTFTLTVTFADSTTASALVTVSATNNPTVIAISPTQGQVGSSMPVTLTGTNFQSGATVSVGAGITVSNVAIASATSLTATLVIAAGATPGARDVIVTNPGSQSGTLPAGFTVTSGSAPNNLALNKSASQSSTDPTWGAVAARAVDGNTSGNWTDGSVTHTAFESQPWWQVDLGSVGTIQSIQVWNRTDCCSDRLSAFYVFVSDGPFTSTNLNNTLAQSGVANYFTAGTAGMPTTIAVNRTGRYVRVQLTGTNFLSLAEVQVLGTLGGNPAPTVTVIAPTQGTVGSTVPFALDGTNLQGGATLSLGAGITVSDVAVPTATRLTATLVIASGATPGARDVTVTNPDSKSGTLSSAFSVVPQAQGNNLALNKPATASSVLPPCCGSPPTGFPYSVPNGFLPSFAVDADTNTLAHTNSEPQPWWQVDLGSVASIQTIQVGRRSDCCPEQLTNFYVFVSDNAFTSTSLNATLVQPGVSNYPTPGTAGMPTTIAVNRTGRYVRVQLAGTGYLSIADVQVIGTIGTTAPTVTLIVPNQGTPGSTVPVSLTGTNFQTGATLSVGAGITVSSVSVSSSTQLTATLTIGAGATVGSRDVTITNPGGASATLPGGFSVATTSVTGEANYVYDRLGRLIAVITGSEMAIYQYDPVGNLLSITRQSSAAVSILDFAPRSGLANTLVTIYGTGFSSTKTQNTVTFNGVPATVTSASPTQLVVQVPFGVAPGPIAVTSPNGFASSAKAFGVSP